MSFKGNNHKQKVVICYNYLLDKLGPKLKQFTYVDRLVKTIVQMLSEGALEVRNQAKLGMLTIKNNLANQKELDSLLLRANLTQQQMDLAKKTVDQNDYESLSNYMNTRYGGSMRGSSMDSRSLANDKKKNTITKKGSASGSDGFNRMSPFADQNMQQTFLSGGAQQTQQPNNFGLTGTSNSVFKKRQPSVSKPVDPQIMEEMKNLVANYHTNDWQKRLKFIDDLAQWTEKHSSLVKGAQPSKFIQLADSYCNVIQDNNAKVQNKALSAFRSFLLNECMRGLID